MISLFPHQQEALQETKDFDNIAVYHDMGLGKTFTGSEMMKRFGCKVNLIVCQKSKVQDWVEHFTDNYQMQVFDLTNKKQLGEYHGLSQGQRFFIVGVINYELAWRRKELLADANLIAFRNGLYDLATDELLPFSPDHVITNMIPWDYNPEAYSELCDKTLNKISCQDDEIRALLEECIGYCFFRQNELSKSFFLTGSGSNGKSTFLDMVKNVLGRPNYDL